MGKPWKIGFAVEAPRMSDLGIFSARDSLWGTPLMKPGEVLYMDAIAPSQHGKFLTDSYLLQQN
jgi:hypothetical protein